MREDNRVMILLKEKIIDVKEKLGFFKEIFEEIFIEVIKEGKIERIIDIVEVKEEELIEIVDKWIEDEEDIKRRRIEERKGKGGED